MISKSRNRSAKLAPACRFVVEELEHRVMLSNPSITTVNPPANATGIALNMPITAALTNLPTGGLNANTVISANVQLYPVGLGGTNSAHVPSVVNTTGGGDAIILTPSVNLKPNTTYTFNVTSAVQGADGSSLVPFSENFTTGTTAPPVDQNFAFQKVALATTDGTPFTDMQIGPDGLLYASTEDGRILRYVMNPDGTLGVPQIITSLQTFEGGNRLITGFAFDPASTPTNPILWVSNTFYALSGATNAPNFTSKLTVMSGPNLATVADAIVNLPRSVSDHVNDQPVFQPGTTNLFFCQAGQNAYGAPDTTWGLRPETMLSAAILEVNTTALNLSSPLNALTPDVGGTYNPFAAGAPLTIYADGIRNAFTLMFDSQGQLWAPLNGSSAGGNTPAFPNAVNGDRPDTGQPYNGPSVPAETNVQQTEEDVLVKVQKGAYYGHPDPARGEYVLDDGNPTTGAIPGLAFTAYPAGTAPDANYEPPNYVFGIHNSPDGMIQYEGSAFGGTLNGKFLVAEYSAGDDIVILTPDSNDNVIGGLASTATTPTPDRAVSGLSGFDNPVTLLENPATGYIYVSELGGQDLVLLKPTTVAPAISASSSAIAFNTIAAGNTGAGASRAESVTITNIGTNALAFGSGAFSVIADPTTTDSHTNFTITNAGSLPTSLASGASTTVTLKYTATLVGLQSALLQIKSNDPSQPILDINLHGIGTAGQFGTLEPSLVQVLRAFNIPTIVGAGPDDVNINTQAYPETPDPSSQEVAMQRLVAAGPGPVTITPLASFSSASQPVSRIGYYTPGDITTSTELFTIAKADAQTVSPTAVGSTSFYPGTSPFSLYGAFPGTTIPGHTGVLDVHYSEDVFNTFDPADPRKFRFFPLETANGTVVPNSYIVAVEDYNDPTFNSFINFVGIISNVQPAPNATAGSTPSSLTANNPPVIGVQNLDGVPSDTQMVFSRIQIPNPTVADIVHNAGILQINNSGDQPLVINSLTLSDTTNWMLVNPPAAGTSIAPGGSLTVTVKFIATTDPPHTTNETNAGATDNGLSVSAAGGVWNGTLTITTNDPVNPNKVINLAGYWQAQSEQENEPGLQTITNLIYGYGTVISNTPISASHAQDYPNDDTAPTSVTAYGEEVLSGLWTIADSSQPITVRQLAAYHSQYDDTQTPPVATAAAVGWYVSGSSNVTFLSTAKDGVNEGQTVLPTVKGSTTVPAEASFTTNTTFGWDLDGEKSQDSLNTADIALGRTGHSVRFFPLRDSTGNIVPNSWIVVLDYQDTSFYNSDFQDTVYLISNMAPSTHPPTPTDAQATVGAGGIKLQWGAAVNATGYNVYRFNAAGTAVKITSSPITATSFTDIGAPAGTFVKYQITAVNASSVESVPATASINLSVTSNAVSTPAAPVIVNADGSSGTAVALSWTTSSGAASYIVLREGPGQSSFSQLVNGVAGTTYSDTAVTVGSTYQYEIEAHNASGNSLPSAPMSATVNSPLTAPATPANPHGDGSSGTSAILTWTASSGAATYDVLREAPGESSFTAYASGLTTLTFTDTAVTAGNTYQYEIDAANAAGTSAPTSPTSVTIVPPISLPATPGMFQESVSGDSVVLTWAASSGAASYTLKREGPSDTTFSQLATGVTNLTFTDTNVVAGSTYRYVVEAVNSAGASADTAPISATLAPPGATLDVTVGKGSNKTVQFTTANGTAVTIKLAGLGTATVHFTADNISSATSKAGVLVSGTNISIGGITITGTAASSSLSVKTKGGNGTVNIGAISADASLGSIAAPTSTLIGAVTLAGSVNKISFGIASAAAITVAGALQNFQAGSATGVTITSAGVIKNITANTWSSNQPITAPSINTINIKGDAEFVVDTALLHSLKVKGMLHDSTLNLSGGGFVDLAALNAGAITNTTVIATGNLGSIAAATMTNSRLYAGVGTLGSGQTLPQFAADFTAADLINSVKLKALKGINSFVNSSIAASQIKTLSLGGIQYANGSIPFGVAALAVNSFTTTAPSTGKPLTFKKLTSQAIVTADFSAKAINPQDFVLRIV